MKRLRLGIIVVLLLLPTFGILLQLVAADVNIFQSGNVTVDAPPYGEHLVVHPNVANMEDYYAVLYNDGSGNLRLAAFNYITNALQFTQQVVSSTGWVAGSYIGYSVSNCPSGSTYFYVAYHWTWNTIGVRLVTLNYTAAGTLYNFIIGSPATIVSSNMIYDSGIDTLLTSDGILWVGFIYQTSVLNAQIAKYDPSSGVAFTTVSIALNFLQIWSIQLASAAGNVYALTYGVELQEEAGKLYNAVTGTLVYTTTYYPSHASMVSLNTGSLVIIYQGTNGWVAYVTYDGTTATETSIMYYLSITDIAAFALPNQYYGFYFTDDIGLSLMYYGYSYASTLGWSAITTVLANPAGYTQAPLSADRDATIKTLVAHPTVWVCFAGASRYGNLISLNLAATNSVTYTTYYIQTTMSVYTTSTSLSSVYAHSTTITTTNTQSLSGLQTSDFMMTLVILLMFLLVPAGIFGFFLGIPGYAIGSLIGGGLAFMFGKLPLWLLLVEVFMMAALIFMYSRESR